MSSLRRVAHRRGALRSMTAVLASGDCDCFNVTRVSGMITITEICFLAWAILGMIVVAILLRLPERGG